MRILLLTDAYPPARGGVATHVADLAGALARRGHAVTVAVLGEATPGRAGGPGAVDAVGLGGTFARLGRAGRAGAARYHPPVPDPAVAVAVRHLVRRRRIDVVHAHGWIALSSLSLTGSRPPLVLTLHDYGFGCARMSLFDDRNSVCPGPRLLRCVPCAADGYGRVPGAAAVGGLRLSRPVLRRAERFVAISRFVADRAVEWGLPPERLEVIPSAIGLAQRAATVRDRSRPPFLPPTGTFAMFAGALGAHKGYDVLLAAYARAGVPLPLVVAGIPRMDAPAVPRPRGVILVEDAAREDVLGAWAACRFAIVPSVYPEPLGLVALEAMSAGRAVIATRVGGLAEVVVDGETGLLVPPGDVEALARAIRRLAGDPGLCERLGRAGRARVGAFDGLDRIEALYRSLVNDARSRTAPGGGTAGHPPARSRA